MVKYYCDRCGEQIFKGSDGNKGNVEVLHYTISRIVAYPDGYGVNPARHNIDLCKKCTKELDDWIHGSQSR